MEFRKSGESFPPQRNYGIKNVVPWICCSFVGQSGLLPDIIAGPVQNEATCKKNRRRLPRSPHYSIITSWWFLRVFGNNCGQFKFSYSIRNETGILWSSLYWQSIKSQGRSSRVLRSWRTTWRLCNNWTHIPRQRIVSVRQFHTIYTCYDLTLVQIQDSRTVKKFA